MTSVVHLSNSGSRNVRDRSAADRYEAHLDALTCLFRQADARDGHGVGLSMDEALRWIVSHVGEVHAHHGKVMVIGNGGSAAIASHLAIDFTRNGGVPAMVFNDGAGLTCMGNDLGFERIFAEQIKLHGRNGDLLIAISSSGASPNILAGVEQALVLGCSVVTFSGFSPDNPLRKRGNVNLYVPSSHYGQVEVTHQMLCHAVIDFGGRWS